MRFKRKWLFAIGLMFVASALCSNVWAQENSKKDKEERIGVLSGVGSTLDRTHTQVSDRFSRFITQIDDFLGAEETEQELNTSWVRVRIDAVKPGADDPKLAGTVKLRIVLPQAQQRYRLLLSTGDDDNSAANTDAAQREQLASEDDTNVALALRFVKTARERSSLNYDIGARYRDDKAQIFGRLNVGYTRDWKYGFTNRFTNSFTYYSASGFDNRFRIDSRRLFFDKESLFFRNSVEVTWRKGLKGAGVGETMGIYADLGSRKALALEGITGYSTALNDGQTDRYLGAELRLRFRHSVWRPWFFYEVWPSVSWSSSNDYERAYGGLIRFEVTFGQN